MRRREFLKATAASLPSDRAIDGRSFLPQLRGEKGNPRDWIFCHYWDGGRSEEGARELVQDRRWKLYDNGDLYDLASDITEKTPVGKMSKEAAAARKRLQKALERSRL